MAKLIWSEPALKDLHDIADFIALDKPTAARRFVQKVFQHMECLESFPQLGRVPAELRGGEYRELVVPPCRIFYRIAVDTVYIVFVMRGERLFKPEYLAERESNF